jgi:hypothetical protein
MNRRSATFTLIAALLLACTALASLASAQNDPFANPVPAFVAGPQHPPSPNQKPGPNLVQWNGSFTDLTHVSRHFTMVGTNPATTNVTSNVTVWVIPIKFVYNASHGNHTFDPQHKLSNGRTVVQNTLLSPLFQSGIDFKQGATDLGKTQYTLTPSSAAHGGGRTSRPTPTITFC